MRFGIREAIFLVLLLATPIAAYVFLFGPRNAMISEARAEIRQKQEKLQQLEAATGRFQDLDSEIEKLTEAISLFEKKLPAEREVDVILKQVWELAARHGLTPKSIRTDKPVAAASYSELPIRMVIVGDFDGFYSFLLDLEKLRRVTRMPEMALKKSTRNEEGQMQAQLVLSIFFEPQNQGAREGSSGTNSS